MEVQIFTDLFISILKNNVKKNIEKYKEPKTFIVEDIIEGHKTFDNTGIIVEDFQLLNGIENDAKNAVIIHKAMKNLLPVYAREEKIWSFLCHTKCWDYMQSRWGFEEKANEKAQESRIKSRYFFGNHGRERNGLSRLWWAANTVYNENLDNPYEYIEELFVSQDLFVGLLERDFGKNKDITTAVLKVIREENLLNEPGRTEKIRKALKDIRFSGGLVLYEALPIEIIENKIREIIINAKNSF